MAAIQYNPFDFRFRTEPYPLYRLMRETDPVLWNPFLQVWVVTRYKDNVSVLTDTRFSADRRDSQNPFARAMVSRQEEFGPLGRSPTMLGADPPEHTRLRRLTSKAFTARRVEEMRPHIQQVVDDLLAGTRDEIDIIKDLAYPLPVIVIAEMLGVPPEDRDTFKAWSNDIAAALGAPFVPPAILERSKTAVQEMADYFSSIVARRRKDPRNDLISALLAAQDQRQALSEDELLATCMLLLSAGNETTTHLIGNSILALLQHPEQLQRLKADPGLMPGAVEEFLRHQGPVQSTSRVARGQIEIEGRQISDGQVVVALVAAANRDPEVFPDPDVLDICRAPNPHLAFGDGIHFCLGAALARAEAQIAISGFLAVARQPRLAVTEPEWINSFVLRGLRSLPVVL